jgi:hypothetical protein
VSRAYYPKGKRWWVRLHKKGGKRHEMPAHHTLEAYLDAYIQAAGIGDEGKSPLFRSAVGRNDTLTDIAMNRVYAWRMIQRRAAALGMRIKVGCHTFRATGITAYLEPAERSRTRKPWPCTKARGPPSSMTARAMRSRSTRWSGLLFDRRRIALLNGPCASGSLARFIPNFLRRLAEPRPLSGV